MKKKLVNNICQLCKHDEDEHFIGTISHTPACSLCNALSLPNEYHKFKLSNLDYLERLYEEKSTKN